MKAVNSMVSSFDTLLYGKMPIYVIKAVEKQIFQKFICLKIPLK